VCAQGKLRGRRLGDAREQLSAIHKNDAHALWAGLAVGVRRRVTLSALNESRPNPDTLTVLHVVETVLNEFVVPL
jgi:hypothetical protein